VPPLDTVFAIAMPPDASPPAVNDAVFGAPLTAPDRQPARSIAAAQIDKAGQPEVRRIAAAADHLVDRTGRPGEWSPDRPRPAGFAPVVSSIQFAAFPHEPPELPFH
jgi:hypothetical protein